MRVAARQFRVAHGHLGIAVGARAQADQLQMRNSAAAVFATTTTLQQIRLRLLRELHIKKHCSISNLAFVTSAVRGITTSSKEKVSKGTFGGNLAWRPSHTRTGSSRRVNSTSMLQLKAPAAVNL